MTGYPYNVSIEPLRDGHSESISVELGVDVLLVSDESLYYEKGVSVQGDAYLAGQELILRFQIAAHAVIPCSICNEPVHVEIGMENFYHSEPLENIKSGVFDFREVVREAILLETPAFAECNQGQCMKREELSCYFKKNETNENEIGSNPFANL